MPRRNSVAAVATCLALLALAVAASLLFGSLDAPGRDVLRVLVAPDGGELSSVVHDLRMPRTVLALAAGAALGVAGAQFQALTRNALADPGLLGVSAGAALAVVATAAFLGLRGPGAQAGAALLGALLTSLVVFVLAGGRRGRTEPVTLILTGVAISAVLASVTTVIVLSSRAGLDEYRFWQVGALGGRQLGLLRPVVPLLLAGVVLAAITSRRLDDLALGDDVARGLGAQVAWTRALVTASAAVLTAGAVALAGPITFVGLVVPHLGRLLVGPDHRRLLPVCALLGPAMLLLADVLGRVVTRPVEVQAGVVTALIGAPVLVLVARKGRFAR